ncbi:MAG: UDP-N-acetylmuramoyl-L-alanyl-D-glutamate--2,6-diaminopimelate ligase, partial [Gemmatimonadetes bacterium]|nr:UDP-N-acetylmuramoyl-L-alanyl-D-glutamate--2,6-diaminopimelate ligase [Gemmatimonadota bacterium]NIS31738.1 UDP-N-acetylmuramoyl-L-alanyl-D-glutamate--2,6-diaminopimelate ligase [Actinomycetota bacterium]NIU66838.1 UDP-N-acetylmuramoyl-L-alanyl-D-glutamate--2,6-diaminopimelate ligase [Actinomycetota bacterium]NIW28638.1 UDP-N-acetylmuramoyl-L-alanyl-D-glutamate--2,6-diaminopimelate ligase [Actinomycetota bacterium]NIX21100.1 UDP-N-acetylmuramoyl-L-alanyl-D-glutamate--2,6-diaminopimelate liga
MGRVAAEGADFIIVTSDNPRHEVPNAIIAEIIPGLGDAEFEVLEDRRAAIQRALELAGQEDLVLLAGKG